MWEFKKEFFISEAPLIFFMDAWAWTYVWEESNFTPLKGKVTLDI